MSLFVTVSVETPLLETAVERASATNISISHQKMAPDGTIDLTVRTVDGDPARFEEGLDADATAARCIKLGEDGDGRLYQVYLTEYGGKACTYEGWADEDAIFISATPSGNGWHETIRFRDRSALKRYADFCERRGISCSLLRVRDADYDGGGLEYGLTEVQEQTLVTALRHGYYAVPRETSLQDLAESFDISHQALSERLRRGVGTLVGNTVGQTPPEVTDDAPVRPDARSDRRVEPAIFQGD